MRSIKVSKSSSKRHFWALVSIAATASGEVFVVSDLAQKPVDPPIVDELNWILQRARQGDEESLPALREALETRPELWEHYGNLGNHALESWLRLASGTDLALRESTRCKAEQLKRELAGAHPSALETLLVERVLLNWLQLN